ncbi:MAG TPA: hypothetical protein VFS39_16175 [Nitrospira sp.]|nr:hypothetical protein [Nitrospira sp.]
MTTAAEVAAGVQTVIYPENAESTKTFEQPIQIRWPEVDGNEFILCVGTSDGNWDILSGNLGKRQQQLFDFSDVPGSVQIIFVQLISGEDGIVGPVITITRKH